MGRCQSPDPPGLKPLAWEGLVGGAEAPPLQNRPLPFKIERSPFRACSRSRSGTPQSRRLFLAVVSGLRRVNGLSRRTQCSQSPRNGRNVKPRKSIACIAKTSRTLRSLLQWFEDGFCRCESREASEVREARATLSARDREQALKTADEDARGEDLAR